MYRIAGHSKIAYALISAAKSHKNVVVFVELKAWFDEANNLKWAKLLKTAGVKIIYSLPSLKVHAKFVIAKMKTKKSVQYLGLLATGNLNETTARLYTDHILLTAFQPMMQEMDQLFGILKLWKLPAEKGALTLRYLLVAQFNLQQAFMQLFMQLIDAEIAHARQRKPAMIVLKINNLEERKLISELYEASYAGVHITLIIRGIYCLVPGIEGMS